MAASSGQGPGTNSRGNGPDTNRRGNCPHTNPRTTARSVWYSLRVKKLLKRLLLTALAGISLVALYFLLALLGALIPRNASFESARGGIQIWVRCNEIHSDLVVPVRHHEYDWSTVFSSDDPERVDRSFKYASLGWGNRKFYLETPTWGDVTVGNLFSAFFGLGDSAMHVEWLKVPPTLGSDCRTLRLTPDQYRRLCGYVHETVRTNAEGRALHIQAPGYVDTDAFYEAKGRYHAFSTCNAWTGRALATGGVRVGAWTPFKWGVLWHLPAPQDPSVRSLRK